MAPKKKLTKEEQARKKAEAAKARLARIKNDPVLLAEYKEKERLKYLKKKEKGQRKCVKDMTSREHRQMKKKWKKYSADCRMKESNLKKRGGTYMKENTPPSSDDENSNLNEPVNPQNNSENIHNNQRIIDAKRRSRNKRKLRNKQLKRKDELIEKLQKGLKAQKKKYYRLKKILMKKKKALTPKTKITCLAQDPTKRAELVKKALFGEVLKTQIAENYSSLKSRKEKSKIKRLLSGSTAKKYKLWRLDKFLSHRIKSKSKPEGISIKKNRIVKIIQAFYEDDSNSRCAAGKKECITRKGVKKQKRYLMDSVKNLHVKFLNSESFKISYSLFCRLRPFWVVPPKLTDRDTCGCTLHENIDLKLSALKDSKILNFANHQSALQILCCDRYSENCLSRICRKCFHNTLPYSEFNNTNDIPVCIWSHAKEKFKDPKSGKERCVMKHKKQTMFMKPRDLILRLEEDFEKLFKHEVNIVHQHKTMKYLKANLTEKDALIHMDFSENYVTKCNKEIQAYHFGGSRQQISLHTVVTYTKNDTSSYCTISSNTSHNAGAIWAHLQPILLSLPPTVENLHFLSDGPVTQYRNKTMFFVLACKLQDFFQNLIKFTWNYHEAGHGKGAPDGVGATCKRTADKIIAQKADITNLYDFVNILRENCPGIKISVIDDSYIEKYTELVTPTEYDLIGFKGTLLVHQVTGDIYSPGKLIMKSLSCFCCETCKHYKIGTIEYKNKRKLEVATVFTDSEDDLPQKFESGDYVLIRMSIRKKEYRYAAVCSRYDDEEGELLVTFLKVCNEDGTLFKVDENDVADVRYEDVIEKLPNPSLTVKGDRVYYKFNKSVNVFEK